MLVVGLLRNTTAEDSRQLVAAFLEGFYGCWAARLCTRLKDAGFVEGKNISVEIHYADGHYDRLPSLAAELAGRDVAAILTTDLPSAFAAKAATKTIPIVFVTGADPIKVGLVDTLSRPTGNLNGMSVFFSVLGPNRVELLHEPLPAANAIALLANPGNVNIKTDEPEIQAAADCLKQRLEVLVAALRDERTLAPLA